MSTRRVILGNLGGGTFGLRVSLPTKDVITDAGDENNLSFDSGWTDIVKMIQVGVASKTVADSAFAADTNVLFTDPGYIPFVEVRQRSGLRVYDDYFPYNDSGAVYHGVAANMYSDRFGLRAIASGSSWLAYDVVYAVFRVPVPAT
jgi:hypothetical protein